MGFIDFTNGEVLTADQMDTVMRQGIMRFADASARDTALSAVLAEGMMAYLDDTDEVLKYDGTNWIDISGDITGVTAGTALTGGGTSGNVTLDVDEAALTIAQSQVTDLVSDLADKQDDVITTQGDLIIGDASGDPVRLPVGSADQVLTSDGTTVSFQDAGGGGTLELISTTTLSGDQTDITGIPSGFRALKLVFRNLSVTDFGVPISIRLNSDSADNYFGDSSLQETGGLTDKFGVITQINRNLPNEGIIDLEEYAGNHSLKIFKSFYIGFDRFDSTQYKMKSFFGAYQNSSPITSISIIAGQRPYNGGTVFLYGVN